MNGVHYVERTHNGNVRRFSSMDRLGADVRSVCFIRCVTWETTEFALFGPTVYVVCLKSTDFPMDELVM